MRINDFPQEILAQILETAAALNEREGAIYSFGLIRHTPVPPPTPFSRVVTEKYVRGQVPTDYLRWDATTAIRETCSRWRDWALSYAVRDIFIKQRLRNDKWLELPHSRRRSSFAAYELMGGNLRGAFGHHDPLKSLKSTSKALCELPDLAANVQRLWFGVFLCPATERFMLEAICSCANLKSVTLPWQALRCFTPGSWNRVFAQTALQSLELTTIALPAYDVKQFERVSDHTALRMIDFSQLRRLKLFGNATSHPLTDEDLVAIAQTATQLEEFLLTSLSTVTIAGVMAIVKAAQQTLRVLEHSPRSRDGFDHPHPGQLPADEHVCEILAGCPQLKDVSVSLPSMCPALFANADVKWQGDCQVRALTLCEGAKQQQRQRQAQKSASGRRASQSAASTANQSLRALLEGARDLTDSRTRLRLRALTLELFFADFIFDPHAHAVHGEFKWFREISGGAWPEMQPSMKGPYGATGWYGKEEGPFEKMNEGEFLERVPVMA